MMAREEHFTVLSQNTGLAGLGHLRRRNWTRINRLGFVHVSVTAVWEDIEIEGMVAYKI